MPRGGLHLCGGDRHGVLGGERGGGEQQLVHAVRAVGVVDERRHELDVRDEVVREAHARLREQALAVGVLEVLLPEAGGGEDVVVEDLAVQHGQLVLLHHARKRGEERSEQAVDDVLEADEVGLSFEEPAGEHRLQVGEGAVAQGELPEMPFLSFERTEARDLTTTRWVILMMIVIIIIVIVGIVV